MDTWFRALTPGVALLLLVILPACSTPPTCPTCPTLDLQLAGPRNLLLQGDTPTSGQTWGRVEILLSPGSGVSAWKVPKDKLQAAGSGWVFSSNFNQGKGIDVILLGQEQGNVVAITTMSISVWLSAKDISDLTSDLGFKVRLRLAAEVTSSVTFQLSGFVWQAPAANSQQKQICRGQFVLGNQGQFAVNGTPVTIQGECKNQSNHCWQTCPAR